MADNEKKPVIHVLPAILTGAAALIAALTTVYINVRNDMKPSAAPPAVVTGAKSAKPEPAKPAQPQELRLQLRRVAVQQDGAVGDADWRFAIEADGEPLFVFEQESMTSEGGRNIVVVADDGNAHATLELKPGKRIPITVKGWRSGWFKNAGEPLVQGDGWLTSAGALAPITAKAPDERKGAFTFYFSATAERD